MERNIGQHGQQQETQLWIPKRELLVVTDESLMRDNESEEAQNRRENWTKEVRENKNGIVIWACSDSRLILPYRRTVHIRSIASGGQPNPYERLFKDDSFKGIVLFVHHDGNTAVPGRMPKGCGGLAAKAAESAFKAPQGELDHFVRQHVKHQDFIIQAYSSAFDIAEQTDKPILAVTQDHITGIVYPIGAFSNKGKTVENGGILKYLLAKQYDPSKIYEQTIPVIRRNQIPEVFIDFLTDYEAKRQRTNARFPDLYKTQQQQNPSLTVISTDISPFAVRYPQTSARPGTVFELRVPRVSMDLDTAIEPEALQATISQAQYPLDHFSNNSTLFIETWNLGLSIKLAEDLARRDFVKIWMKKNPANQILVGQTSDGIATSIQSFVPHK